MSLERRYLSGEALSTNELVKSEEGLHAYERVIHPDWSNDRATRQRTLEGDIIVKKVTPVLTYEQEHLKRPSEEPKKVLPLRGSGWGTTPQNPTTGGSGWGNK